MILPFRLRTAWVGLCFVIAIAGDRAFAAAPASDTILPANTVLYISATDPTELEAKFNKTQIGQLAQDETMQAFVEQLEDQINRKFGDIKDRLGVTLDELRAAAGGELTAALIHRTEGTAAFALSMNVTNHRPQLEELLKKIDAHLLGQSAKKSNETVAGATLTIYVVPSEGERAERTAVYFERDDVFCTLDNLAEARAMAERFAKPGMDSLSSLEAFQETQSRCRQESKELKPDVRWFVDPFKYDLAMKSINPPKEGDSKRKDTMQILREQGFDAIVGVGGFVNFAVDVEHDVVHRTAVYAPPVEGASAGKKYNLAMEILQLANGKNLQVEPWTPRMIAAYTTANVNLLNGYDHVHTLFDAFSGYEGAFETAMEGFEKDPFGAKVNIRNELIAFLGPRITIMTDYNLPITTDSERYLFAVEVKDPVALRPALERLLDKDEEAQRKNLNEIVYWEIVPTEEVHDLGGLEDELGGVRSEEKEGERVLQRSAVCLHESVLLIASDVEFLKVAIGGVPPQESLSASYDFEAVMQSLREMAPAQQSSWSFCRTDESVRPIYELLRAGKMPESNTFIGRLLNEVLTSEEDQSRGILRKQQVDGKTLPSFELARRYFGPAGRSIRSDEDGWFITGVVLSKAGQ